MTTSTGTSPLATHLFDEWNATLADTLHQFGALGELTCDEAVDLIRMPQPAEQRDAVLLELLTLEHDGDTVAGRVILKSFLPLAFRLARTNGHTRDLWMHDRADATTTAIGVLWEVIHSYPLTRRAAVSGNIRGEMLKLLESGFGSPRSVDDVAVEDDMLDRIVGADETDDVFRDLVTILTWAIDSGALRRDEVQLLARIELAEGDPGQAREDTAAELGISRETLAKRVSRIRGKLMHAVCGDVQAKVAYSPRRS
ncbi:hypothetical protein ACPW96_18335 [Micromonospora sp. DT81.3]|uniref:hypothetical protein n=1 Tax=Micromonospora sp. DT81.3 TaxID=3416523 RepID=UPI003CEA7DDB